MNADEKNKSDVAQAVIDQLTRKPGPTPADTKKDENNFVQKPIRTYESDLAEAIAHGKTSVADIAIAEKKRLDASTSTRKTSQPTPQVTPVKPYIGPKTSIPSASSLNTRLYPAQAPSTEQPAPQPEAPLPPQPSLPPQAPQDIPVAARIFSPPIQKPITVHIPTPIPIATPIPVSIPTPAPVQAFDFKVTKEEETQEQQEIKESKHYGKKIALVTISILLIGGGIAGGYFLYLKSPLAIPAPVAQPMIISSILPSDKKISIAIDSIPKDKLISTFYSTLSKNQLATGKFLEVILMETLDIKAPPTKVPASSFIEKVHIPMPAVLFRSLTDRWMLGAYTEESAANTPFLIFTTDFFQNTYAGMLSWEDTMPDDLSTVLNFTEKAKNNNQNNEGGVINSTTPSSYFSIQGQFVDRQIRNRDVREFHNNQGELLFLYSFINKDTFIITTTESALIAAIDRIEKETYVR